jgi:hypothetical protein
MPASKRRPKINVAHTRGLTATCPSCRRLHRCGEISLVNGSGGDAWCEICLVGVCSPAEQAALAAANALDQAAYDVQLLARDLTERNACAAILGFSAVNIVERRFG